MKFTSEDIASVCHEANRQLTRLVRDVPVQEDWPNISADMRASSINGVEFRLANPGSPPSASHDNWMKERLATGWKLGPVKDVEKKEHPALVPYEQLPSAVQRKDALFTAIVDALKGAP